MSTHKVSKILHMHDIKRLRGNASRETHLVRYDTANDRNVSCVLDIACPHCGATPNTQCFEGN